MGTFISLVKCHGALIFAVSAIWNFSHRLLASNPLVVVRSYTSYGLFVFETCTAPGPSQSCYFVYYPQRSTFALYPYYKSGAVGASFMLSGTVLFIVYAFFMLIKASTGMAGRCLHRFFKNYYILYYLGIIAAFCQALGWGLFHALVPRQYRFNYPFWIFMIVWIVNSLIVLAIFIRKMSQRKVKPGSYINIA